MSRLPGAKYGMLLLALLSFQGCGSSVHDLAAHGDTAGVEAMIREDASRLESRNELGKTPLHYAVTHNQGQTTALLLDLGADVNAQDRTGLTPIHLAAILGYTDIAGLLFAHGAKLDIADDFGDTPLHSAALNGQLPMIERLMDWGSDSSVANAEGLTPAALARKHKHEDAAALIEEIAAELGG